MSKHQVTTSIVFDRLRKSQKKILVLEGSSRSTKTYSTIQYLISLALENENKKRRKKIRIAVVRAMRTWISSTVLVDFKDIMQNQFDIWDDSNFNKSSFIYELGSTSFEFTGLDHHAGQKFHGAKFDYVWFNEAIECDYPSVRQILIRLQGKAIFDYNPNMDENHWMELKIKKRDDVEVMHSTYKDNPFLPQQVVDEIEKLKPTPENIRQGTADETAWQIYGLGIRGVLKGLVFPHFTKIEKFPETDEYVFGMDFGFSNDPTTLIKTAVIDGNIYFEELLYEKGLTMIDNPHNMNQPSVERRLAEIGVDASKQIMADCADPRAIRDLQLCGYSVSPASKGKGSIVNGIMKIKEYRIHITESSYNMIQEFRKYKWIERKDGESSNTPIDNWNHCIDAARYSILGLADNRQVARYGYDSTKPSLNLKRFGY